MIEETKNEEEEKVDETKKEDVEVIEEKATAKEEKETDEEVEKTFEQIVAKAVEKATAEVTKNLQKEKQINKADKSKKENMTHEIKVKEVEFPVYQKQDGKKITMSKTQGELLFGWYKAFLANRGDKVESFYNQINDKFYSSQKLEALNEATAADGGYLVPSIWTNILVDIRDDLAVIRPRATVVPISGAGNTFYFNSVVGRPKMYWSGEAVAKSTTSMTFNQGSLTPYKMAAIAVVTMELEQDSMMPIMALLTKQFSAAVVREEDRVFMVGTGSGQPTGIDAYSLTTHDFNFSLSYGDFVNMLYKLPQAYRRGGRAVWVMNSRTISATQGLTDANGQPIFRHDGQPDPVTGAPVQRLLGLPVLEQNDLASSKIFLGDFSEYYIGDKMPMTMKQSQDATVAGVSMFETNQTAVLVEERLDAELYDTRAFVEGSNTGIS